MGGFYGSVQVRSEDRDGVKAVAEDVARALQCRMLVAPAIDGWVGLYPEMSGQDEQVGAAIAERIDTDVLHLMVHDDDVFAYWLYRDRSLVDSFWSIPGYFGEDNRPQEEAMAGDPEAFRPIVGDKVKLLAPLLERGDDQPIFASDQLEKFAKVLKISNAVSAYEYLTSGETDGIKKWRQFEEVPAELVADQKKEEETKRSQAQDLAQKLKSDGLLLLRDERTGFAAYGCGLGNGFFVAWPAHPGETAAHAEYQSPWDGPRPRSLDTPAHVMGVATSRDGKRLAIAAERRVQVWGVSGTQWSLLATEENEVNEPVTAVALSADGRLLAHASPQQIVVTQIAGERLAVPIPRNHIRQLQFDPTGEWIAVGGANFGLVAVNSQPHWRDLYVGGKIETRPMNPMSSAQLGDIDVEGLVAKQRAQIEKAVDQMRASAKKSKLPEISAEQIQVMRANMEKGIEQMRAYFAAYKAGQAPETPPRAKEQVGCAGFSRDGRWLWCGTHCGLRVYEWSQVPREAGADMPQPTWKFESPIHPQFRTPVWVWTVAEEVDSPAIVFGGGWSGIHRLDLETGETRELVRVGDERSVTSLVMSAEGDTLGSLSTFSPTSVRDTNQGERTCAWDVWTYPRLRG